MQTQQDPCSAGTKLLSQPQVSAVIKVLEKKTILPVVLSEADAIIEIQVTTWKSRNEAALQVREKNAQQYLNTLHREGAKPCVLPHLSILLMFSNSTMLPPDLRH